jgi:hypothetical protein
MKSFSVVLYTGFIILSACGPTRKELPEAELIMLAKEEGNRITMETQHLLGSTLKSKIQQAGIPEALEYCNLNAYPLVDSMQMKYHAIIRRASMDTRNPLDKPAEDEKIIIEDYQSNLKEGKTPEIYVKVKENEVHYARPILLTDAVCLKCHGTVGENISPEHYRIIQNLYPEDQATGHSLGDLRGIWSVKFRRKDLEKRALSTQK